MKTLLALMLFVTVCVCGCNGGGKKTRENVSLPCPHVEPIHITRCFPDISPPTQEQAREILSKEYEHYLCEKGCIKVFALTSVKKDKQKCPLNETSWRIDGTISCVQFPVPKEKDGKK